MLIDSREASQQSNPAWRGEFARPVGVRRRGNWRGSDTTGDVPRGVGSVPAGQRWHSGTVDGRRRDVEFRGGRRRSRLRQQESAGASPSGLRSGVGQREVVAGRASSAPLNENGKASPGPSAGRRLRRACRRTSGCGALNCFPGNSRFPNRDRRRSGTRRHAARPGNPSRPSRPHRARRCRE